MQSVNPPLSNAARAVIEAIDNLDPSVRSEILLALRWKYFNASSPLQFGAVTLGPTPPRVAESAPLVCSKCGQSIRYVAR